MNKKHFYATVILLLLLAIGIQPAFAATYTLVPGTNTYFGEWSDGNTIFTFTSDLNSGDDIYIAGQNGITLEGAECTITGPSFSGVGVNIIDCEDLIINNLNVTGFKSEINELRFGFIIQNSINITLADNSIWDNNYGIRLQSSIAFEVGNTITNNTISNNSFYGIRLDNSSYNTMTYNTFLNNNCGIRIRAGSTENNIINNNFINNGTQAAVTEDFDQTFDRNYWDDWDGEIPYTFAGGQDNNPLPIQNGWLEPDVLIVQLIDTVADMNLQQGIDNSLDAKLDAAFNALDDINENNDVAAINSLNAFINAVEAQRDKKITSAQADILIAAAQNIIDLLMSG